MWPSLLPFRCAPATRGSIARAGRRASRHASGLRVILILAWAAAAVAGCGDGDTTPKPASHGRVIEIDIDDHGLAGLWMANAPNLKGLIARGTLAYSRVVV